MATAAFLGACAGRAQEYDIPGAIGMAMPTPLGDDVLMVRWRGAGEVIRIRDGVVTGRSSNLTLSGGDNFYGSFAHGGRVFFTGADYSHVLSVDANMEVQEHISPFTGQPMNSAGVTNQSIAPNGTAYFPTWQNPGTPGVTKFNLSTYAITRVGGVSGYAGACYGGNGYMYFTPYATGRIMKMDIANDAVSYIDTSPSSYWGAVMAYDGLIYMAPRSAGARIAIINPADDTVSFSLSLTPAGYATTSDVRISPSGRYIYISNSTGRTYCFDVNTQTFSEISATASFGTCIQNNKLYIGRYSNNAARIKYSIHQI